MSFNVHTMSQLFSQLGLPSAQTDIESFIASHRPMPNDQLLESATFWSSAQSDFLREEMIEDADWAPVIDDLNERLH